MIHFDFIFFFFFNDTATTEIYTLSLHDALPIYTETIHLEGPKKYSRTINYDLLLGQRATRDIRHPDTREILVRKNRDRKSTRLNSSHANISYAVFCLKKKKIKSKHISIILHNSF